MFVGEAEGVHSILSPEKDALHGSYCSSELLEVQPALNAAHLAGPAFSDEGQNGITKFLLARLTKYDARGSRIAVKLVFWCLQVKLTVTEVLYEKKASMEALSSSYPVYANAVG